MKLETFKDLIEQYVLPVEGGYVNDPDDEGGETNWGITRRTARYYGYHGPMEYMSKDTAISIYQSLFVLQYGYNNIWDINKHIAAELVEAEVNVRARQPIIWLQRILNAANIMGKLYPDLTVDGFIGPKTCESLQKLLDKRGQDGVKFVLTCLNHLQGAYYLERAEAREVNEKYFYGWIMQRTV